MVNKKCLVFYLKLPFTQLALIIFYTAGIVLHVYYDLALTMIVLKVHVPWQFAVLLNMLTEAAVTLLR